MNIKEAKEQIKNAMTAYFTKDSYGEYMIPIEKQRPIFLLGAPGIGKTAIMEQVAQELGVGLVSYSMTHHTRQSALGLPFIVKKNYGGQEYDVSEYTMSEIIAAVYDMIEETGHKEGILFLDEINCVSETLAPAMLQFLQYKIFGQHRVPNGWIVVTAGNPPEYNNSVREFDIVTWDRLKKIEITPEYDVWKEYAYKVGIHASITSYLDIKKGDFYKIETTVDGKSFVTARGWSDLSDMIKLYEMHNLTVDHKLISQYLQNAKIAKSFSIYYDLFKKYRSDYQIDKILEGKAPDNIKDRAKAAKFDERLSLLGLLLEGVTEPLKNTCLEEETLTEILKVLKSLRAEMTRPHVLPQDALQNQISKETTLLDTGRKASSISYEEQTVLRGAIAFLSDEYARIIKENPANSAESFKLIKTDYDQKVKNLKAMAKSAGTKLSNVFKFADEVFPNGQELLILVTELTISYYGSHFISHYGCQEYFDHNKNLLFFERQKEIIAELTDLDLED